ncbi:hypothetical protein B0H11DRAFT_1899535 [Mycena galericulata]|nr:hypothetical protein B0H11DRAFT_1899535 [Mycena galericulata]
MRSRDCHVAAKRPRRIGGEGARRFPGRDGGGGGSAGVGTGRADGLSGGEEEAGERGECGAGKCESSGREKDEKREEDGEDACTRGESWEGGRREEDGEGMHLACEEATHMVTSWIPSPAVVLLVTIELGAVPTWGATARACAASSSDENIGRVAAAALKLLWLDCALLFAGPPELVMFHGVRRLFYEVSAGANQTIASHSRMSENNELRARASGFRIMHHAATRSEGRARSPHVDAPGNGSWRALKLAYAYGVGSQAADSSIPPCRGAESRHAFQNAGSARVRILTPVVGIVGDAVIKDRCARGVGLRRGPVIMGAGRSVSRRPEQIRRARGEEDDGLDSGIYSMWIAWARRGHDATAVRAPHTQGRVEGLMTWGESQSSKHCKSIVSVDGQSEGSDHRPATRNSSCPSCAVIDILNPPAIRPRPLSRTSNSPHLISRLYIGIPRPVYLGSTGLAALVFLQPNCIFSLPSRARWVSGLPAPSLPRPQSDCSRLLPLTSYLSNENWHFLNLSRSFVDQARIRYIHRPCGIPRVMSWTRYGANLDGKLPDNRRSCIFLRFLSRFNLDATVALVSAAPRAWHEVNSNRVALLEAIKLGPTTAGTPSILISSKMNFGSRRATKPVTPGEFHPISFPCLALTPLQIAF